MRYRDLYTEIQRGTAAATLPGWARSVLGEVADGRLPIDALRHPLGFLCLPVERSGRLGVCLHLWSPELTVASTTTSQVHCHSWDLISFVLYGRITNVLAEVTTGATHRVFEVLSHGDRDELRATGRTVGYAPGRHEVYGQGEVYTLPAGKFHSTRIPGSGEAATIALGNETASDSDFSLGSLTLPSHDLLRQRYGIEETALAARHAATRLTAAHAF
jgi:hypothetical protein